jgi:hypothetical protein
VPISTVDAALAGPATTESPRAASDGFPRTLDAAAAGLELADVAADGVPGICAGEMLEPLVRFGDGFTCDACDLVFALRCA